MEINVADVVLCEFYFSDLKASKKRPEPLAKLSNAKLSKLIKAPDKPVFLSRLLTIRAFTQLLCRFCKNQGIVVPTIHKITLR